MRTDSPERVPCARPRSVSSKRVDEGGRRPGAAGWSVPGCSGNHPIAAAWPMAFAIVNALLAENSDMIEGGAVVWRDHWPDRFKSFG